MGGFISKVHLVGGHLKLCPIQRVLKASRKPSQAPFRVEGSGEERSQTPYTAKILLGEKKFQGFKIKSCKTSDSMYPPHPTLPFYS